MSLAFFPFYADRYEADTTHLSILEDGAYNRLLRLCWRTPGCKLPHDLPWIFRQMRAKSDEEKAAIVAVLNEFFTKGRGKIWSRRLLEIHMQVSVAHQNKSEAGKKGASAKALKRNQSDASTAKAQLNDTLSNQNQNQNHTESIDGGGGSAGEKNPKDLPPDPTDRERYLEAIGADPTSGMFGPNGKRIGTAADMAEAARWLELPGLTVPIICDELRRLAEAKRDGPPNRFSYFTNAMQRLSAALTAPPLQPTAARPPSGDTEPAKVDMAAIFAGINSDGSLKQ